jgi:hypothetical protein
MHKRRPQQNAWMNASCQHNCNLRAGTTRQVNNKNRFSLSATSTYLYIVHQQGRRVKQIDHILDLLDFICWHVAPHAHGIDDEVSHTFAASALQIAQWPKALLIHRMRRQRNIQRSEVTIKVLAGKRRDLICLCHISQVLLYFMNACHWSLYWMLKLDTLKLRY